MVDQRGKFYQFGSGPTRDCGADPARADDASAALAASDGACPGCGVALAARHAMDAALRASGGELISVSATGCLEMLSTPTEGTPRTVPWIHSLVGNAAAVAGGVAAALALQGRSHVRVIAQGGDGATMDIGFGCLSGMFERNDDVLYLCYDNEGCMNTGGQRSSATPAAADTATTRGGAPAGASLAAGKSMPRVAMAHGVAYVATASVCDPSDLEAKVTKAMAVRGARYLHVHAPCPFGWGSQPDDTIEIARLAVQSGLFPLFEAEDGEITARTTLADVVPVTEYLKRQQRFAHLFEARDDPRIAQLQAIADRNIRTFSLHGDAADR